MPSVDICQNVTYIVYFHTTFYGYLSHGGILEPECQKYGLATHFWISSNPAKNPGSTPVIHVIIVLVSEP